MNLNNFIDTKDVDKEYGYNILVYPNITYQKDLEKILMLLSLATLFKN